MPREYIRDQASQYNLAVGWQRDGADVQIGIETADGRPIVDHLTVTSIDGPGGQTSDTAAFASLWGNLSRAGVNDLIRLLQRARDGAFGKDA
jgi:hypothetical protein